MPKRNGMNYKEIRKALECCIKLNCDKCALKTRFKTATYCRDDLLANALDFIKRQEVISRRSLQLLKVSEENERILNQNQNLRCVIDDLSDQVNTTKTDAVKEYVAMVKADLIKGGIYPVLVKNTLDKIKKEMVGED